MPLVSDESLYQYTEKLASLLLAQQKQLVTAESCTGGWLAKCCTDLAGSSVWFQGGIVSYSNALKRQLLQVSEATLMQHGAVSEPVVRAMAMGALQQLGGDVSVAISGIAGPSGGTKAKPIGLVWFGFANSENIFCTQKRFTGDRSAVRQQAVAFALTELIKMLE
ncbi:C-terminal domain of CinA type S [Methylophaga frappieri]|uniref:C-terminal domain of CinA type S n=1 Tax=Methylophaga frappieri (strain ATCC BAA-2434 / DSM 25690 / JAM7) TaxID=754477 RepID=I1YEQ7_METFJ|nr:nicotinamide-nucleotide amidohydrolase family protein [Methylophaga frappieri]AFJ01400.1 C-terminal domain of CinA type S [Methylophaga frappieri]